MKEGKIPTQPHFPPFPALRTWIFLPMVEQAQDLGSPVPLGHDLPVLGVHDLHPFFGLIRKVFSVELAFRTSCECSRYASK